MVVVEDGFEGGIGHGMGIKSRHWVTFKHRIRCTRLGSVVSIEEQSGKREGETRGGWDRRHTIAGDDEDEMQRDTSRTKDYCRDWSGKGAEGLGGGQLGYLPVNFSCWW